MTPINLLYISHAATGTGDDDVRRILATAAHHNAQHGVTGALLAYAGYFLQVLEGAATAVDETFERIRADPRHQGVRLIERSEIDTPHFVSWSMRRVPAPRAQDRAVTDFLGVLARGADPEQAHTAHALLQRLGQSRDEGHDGP